jgi:dipeptidyl aminopeptidase/acylaminoacyl peptidase
VALDGDDVYWLEGRPAEGGRNVLVRRRADGTIEDVTPSPFNVRTRVHEYGGGAYIVDDGTIWFSNFADQRVYRIAPRASTAHPLTPEGAWFYADFCYDRTRRTVIAVREDHSDATREAVTTLVAIDDDGHVRVIAAGYDFYSTPRVSPDGRRLAWLCWNHPQMPWDGTELWVATIGDDGSLVSPACVAGGTAESIYQPGWLADGTLVFAGDRTGWWQLYRWDASTRETRAVVTTPPADTEFGRPSWTFGTAVWAEASPGTLVAAYATKGIWRLGVVELPPRQGAAGGLGTPGLLRDIETGFDPQEWLVASGHDAVLVAASPRRAAAIVRVSLRDSRVHVLKESAPATIDAGDLSEAQGIEFSTADGGTGYAFYYPPRNRDIESRSGRPPLVAISHGGPTAATTRTLDVRIQYWTTRGFAVVDVNYGGSTGYGRRYRERLRGEWGYVDVDDMIHAVRALVDAGKADPERLIIRGGSAGGYTTLAALTFHPGIFKAGASYYGVSDLELLARDTHKFEARYLDSLVGPYPAMAGEYRARSPIHFTDRLACAVIFFQGLDDHVVPPNQSALMADAVRRKGLPVAYVAFEGEQHGFRKAENIVRSLEAELSFYGAVFGFVPAGYLDQVAIDNL